MRIRFAALLPMMLTAGLLSGLLSAAPAGSVREEPPVQMIVTPAR